MDQNRRHKRLNKIITLGFCVPGSKSWEMSVVENISAGGVRFIAPTDIILSHKVFQLKIRVPELAPNVLEVEAEVVDAKLRKNPKVSDVRAKFINLSDANQKYLLDLENLIEKKS